MSTIELNDYEVVNLRSAIEAIGYPHDIVERPRNPLMVLNTGDWLGQIYLKLPKVDTVPNHIPKDLIAESLKD